VGLNTGTDLSVSIVQQSMTNRVGVLLTVLALGASGCASSDQSAPPRPSTASPSSSPASVPHSTGSADVIFQIGDYHVGWGPSMSVTGPEIVVYGDGAVFANLSDGAINQQPTYSLIEARMSEQQMQDLLAAGNALPVSSTQNSLPVDTFPTVLVAGSHRWEINDPTVEPYAAYLTELRAITRSLATSLWQPSRWIVRPSGAAHCNVVAEESGDQSYEAPVYPHLLDTYPIGEFDCAA
jgi:hypothetical protein